MKTRVNLTIENDLLRLTKKYAETHHTSVSELVEQYFKQITKPKDQPDIFDLIKSLPKPDIAENRDLKKEYYEDRADKYGF